MRLRARRDRRPVLHLGSPEQHVERLRQLESLGVDQFAVYLQHDAKTATLDAYGESVLPAMMTTEVATESGIAR